MVLMSGHGQLQKLGRTRDDAAGEAFDKGARILGLGYPGGPAMEKAADGGKPSVPFTRAWLKGNDDFSFSGLKTALLHWVRENEGKNDFSVNDAAASFQQAVIDILATKTVAAARRVGVRQILLCGGVAANKALRERFLKLSSVPVLIPPPNLCTDNAAMVAACGYYHMERGKVDGYDLDVVPSLSLGS